MLVSKIVISYKFMLHSKVKKAWSSGHLDLLYTFLSGWCNVLEYSVPDSVDLVPLPSSSWLRLVALLHQSFADIEQI